MIGSLIISIGDSCFFIDNRIECDFLSVEKNTIFGNFLAVLGAVSASGYLLAGRKLRHTIALPVYLLLSYGVGAAILILVNIIIRNPFFTYPPITYLLFLLLALLPQLIGHSSLNWALGYLPTVVVSISLLGEPVGSTILAYLFLGEVPQPAKLIGAILILIGIATSFVEPRPTISRDKKKCSFNDPY
jgi:drug/metabolite transporter (DMT)-like permease